MNVNHSIKLLVITLISLVSSEQIQAQTSAYHGIVFPYETSNHNSLTIGGIINAIPDQFSGAQANPGGLAFLKRSSVAVNYSFEMSRYNVSYPTSEESNDHTRFKNFPGFLSATLPISFWDKKIVFGFYGQHLASPEVELWDEFEWDALSQVNHNRSGNVWNTNFALSSMVFKNLGVGLNVSKWFGSWTWQDKIDSENSGSGTFNYSGTSLALGLIYQWSKINLGLTLHSPFTLMSSNDTRIENWFFNIQTHHIEQKFDGAVRLGLTYDFSPQTQAGIDYRWQGKIYINNRKYGISHRFSAAFDHDFRWSSLYLPVFITYQMSLMPVTEDISIRDYQLIGVDEKENIRHSISTGLNILYDSYGIYLTANWNQGSITVSNNSTPPWS